MILLITCLASFSWFLSAGVSSSACIPDRFKSLETLTGVLLPKLLCAVLHVSEEDFVSTGLSLQQTLGWGVAFLGADVDCSFVLFLVENIAGDFKQLLLFKGRNGEADGTREGVASFWSFGMLLVTPGVAILGLSNPPPTEFVDFPSDCVASYSFIKEMQVSEFSNVGWELVVIIFWCLEVLLQGVMSLWTLLTGVLNWRFLIGVLDSGVPVVTEIIFIRKMSLVFADCGLNLAVYKVYQKHCKLF